jgi:hypothetical protein
MGATRFLAVLIAGGLGLAAGPQAPAFTDAYLQRLGGATDELRRVMGGYEAAASAQGLTLEAYISRHATNADPAVRATAGVITASGARLERLATAQARLRASPDWWRPIVLLQHHDPEILAAAHAAWRPRLVLDPIWGAVGAALGLLVGGFVLGLPGFGRSTSRRMPPPGTSTKL